MDSEGHTVGPVTVHGLLELQTAGYVSESSYIWASHLPGWTRMVASPEVRKAARGEVEPPKAAAAAAAAPSLAAAVAAEA